MDIERYNALADAYGIGTAISNAPVIDFSMDIVEVNGRPLAKRGKMSGSKRVFRCPECFETRVRPFDEGPSKCSCGGGEAEILVDFFSGGAQIHPFLEPFEIRDFVLQQAQKVDL
jgi:nicotinate phosphoribosyltransferase